MACIANTKTSSLDVPWAGELSSGKHHYITDKPESFGGGDTGPAPYDYLLAGLAACNCFGLLYFATTNADMCIPVVHHSKLASGNSLKFL